MKSNMWMHQHELVIVSFRHGNWRTSITASTEAQMALKAEQLRKQELFLLPPSQASTPGENGLFYVPQHFFHGSSERSHQHISSRIWWGQSDCYHHPDSQTRSRDKLRLIRGLILLLIKTQRTTSRELCSSNKVKHCLPKSHWLWQSIWTTATIHAPVISLPCGAVLIVFWPVNESCYQSLGLQRISEADTAVFEI